MDWWVARSCTVKLPQKQRAPLLQNTGLLCSSLSELKTEKRISSRTSHRISQRACLTRDLFNQKDFICSTFNKENLRLENSPDFGLGRTKQTSERQ